MTRLDDWTPPIGADDTAGWAHRFEILSDPTRLALLSHMHLHPGATVGELACAAQVSRDAASQALRGLRTAGLVAATRDGRLQRYELTDGVAHALLHWLGHDHHEPARDHFR